MDVRIFGVGLIFAGSLVLAGNVSDVQASGRLRPAAISVSAGTIDLVKDINIGSGSGGTCGQTPKINGLVLGNKLVFAGKDGLTGCELWVTDGTSTGTTLLKDINVGGNGSDPNLFTLLPNGRAIFKAADINGFELWITDGTTNGTLLLKDINTGGNSSNPDHFAVLSDGRVIFQGSDTSNGVEVWITDGTANGTVLVRDIDSRSWNGSGYGSSPAYFTALTDGRAIFQAQDPVKGQELWVTDGTANGTVLVKDIKSGDNGSFPTNFTVLPDGRVIFQAQDAAHGSELWVTDGTTEGTVLVKDIYTGSSNGYVFGSEPAQFRVLPNGSVIFSAYDSTNGGELWVTDGTTEGTVLVKDIYTGSSNGSGNNAYPRSITVIDDLAYFWAADSQSGSKAWVTDGTSANTRLMTDGVSISGIGAPSDSAASGGEFVKFGNRIYFRGNDSFNGSELWSTAIALEDAAIVADIWPGTSSGMQCSGSPMSCGGGSANDRRMLLLNGRLVFLANGGNIGFELWTMTLQPPGAPRDIAISATLNSATVSWSAPARVGSGITWYTVTSNPGAFTCVTATLTCSVAGLLSNQDYTFTVVASDATSDGSPAISSRIRTPSPQLGSLVDSLTSVSNIVSDSVLHPGDALNVLYSGFNPNELVLLLIASNPVVIGSANADANGNVVFLTTIPAGTPTGSHHLIVYAPVSGFGASQAVTVSIPTPVAGTTGAAAVVNPNVNPDTLPATGGGVIPFLIALTLLIAGFALLAGRSAVSQWVLVLGRRV